jgi:hypothetical protein
MRAPGMPEPHQAPEAVRGLLVSDEAKAILQRLLDAPEMHYVWREFEKRSATNDELRDFIAHACEGAALPIPLAVMTQQQRAASTNLCATIARVCQIERGSVRVQNNPELAAALLLVTQHYEILGREANPLGAPYLVKNHTTNDQDRVYVRLLVHRLRRQAGERLAGKRLSRTVATVASVALDRTITEWQVRDWCAGLH